jgi:hypothetical protein
LGIWVFWVFAKSKQHAEAKKKKKLFGFSSFCDNKTTNQKT